jgi:hypothetical protein
MNGWDEILFTYDEVEAEIVKKLLESEGIQVVVDSMKIRPYPVSIGKMGEMKLMVRKEDMEKAKEVLKTMQDASEEKGGSDDR